MKPVFILLFTLVVSSCNFGHKQPEQIEASPKKPVQEKSYGQIHFERDCVMCHRPRSILNSAQIKRFIDDQGETYARLFITQQDSLINAKDPYALAIKNDFNNTANAHNFDYTEKYLDELMDYLQE